MWRSCQEPRHVRAVRRISSLVSLQCHADEVRRRTPKCKGLDCNAEVERASERVIQDAATWLLTAGMEAFERTCFFDHFPVAPSQNNVWRNSVSPGSRSPRARPTEQPICRSTRQAHKA